jgi:hypothetical protein
MAASGYLSEGCLDNMSHYYYCYLSYQYVPKLVQVVSWLGSARGIPEAYFDGQLQTWRT